MRPQHDRLAGFDFVVLDNEHGPAGHETTEHLVRAACCASVPALVRVPWNSPAEILRALDLGAAGVLVSHVSTAEEAERAVRAAKYPPLGVRGAAFSHRAGGYSLRAGPNHLEESNEATVVVLQIETAQAIANLDAILAVPEADALFIGPTDLSVSMGYPGNPQHPEVQAAIEQAIRRMRAAGVAAGIMVRDVDGYRAWSAVGATLLSVNLANVLSNTTHSLVQEVRQTVR